MSRGPEHLLLLEKFYLVLIISCVPFSSMGLTYSRRRLTLEKCSKILPSLLQAKIHRPPWVWAKTGHYSPHFKLKAVWNKAVLTKLELATWNSFFNFPSKFSRWIKELFTSCFLQMLFYQWGNILDWWIFYLPLLTFNVREHLYL